MACTYKHVIAQIPPWSPLYAQDERACAVTPLIKWILEFLIQWETDIDLFRYRLLRGALTRHRQVIFWRTEKVRSALSQGTALNDY